MLQSLKQPPNASERMMRVGANGNAGLSLHCQVSGQRFTHYLPSCRRCVCVSIAELPLTRTLQIIFTLRAAESPTSIPISLASLSLAQDAAAKFVGSFQAMIEHMQGIGGQLSTIKKVYEVGEIPNVIQDGSIPFPEDVSKIRSGVALEFRYVRFGLSV